jgi:flavodoxin
MDGKKILVVYYSRTGATRKVAEEVAKQLSCELKEIKSTPSYPLGVIGYQRALFHTLFKKDIKISIDQSDVKKYDLVIVGGPAWGGLPAIPVRRFLEVYKNDLKEVAFLMTQGGESGREKFFTKMREACGKSSRAQLAVSKKDFDKGDIKKTVSTFISQLNLKAKDAGFKQKPESFASL